MVLDAGTRWLNPALSAIIGKRRPRRLGLGCVAHEAKMQQASRSR
jgi:hypothetical protein